MIKKITMRFRKQILTVESKVYDLLFALLLLLFTLILLVLTPQYQAESQIVPYVIGVPTAFLLMIILVINVFGIELDLISNDTKIDELSGINENEKSDLTIQRKRTLHISIWVIFLFLVISLIGFLPAIIVFLALYFRIVAGESVLATIGYTIIVWITIIIIFSIILEISFYQGLIWEMMVG